MIGYLKGKLMYADGDTVLLETNGVGYEITCSAAAFRAIACDGKNEVYIYTSVKEDGISLYGFVSPEEKNMFLKLISVSGVGPKMGITVLSGMSTEELAVKIATSDVKGLSAIKGLGKKTAERIILELREKFSAELPLSGAESKTSANASKDELSGEEKDAVIALTGLGFTRNESAAAIDKAKLRGAKSVQELIAFALKNI